MAGRDNVLFGATIASGSTAGTVIPLSLMYGIENVRQGYGQPVLKNVRSYFYGCYSTANASNIGIPVKIKNSNWIDDAGLISQKFSMDTAINRDSYAFMRGRDKALSPNTAWTINAELTSNTTAAGFIYVLLEIEYPDVQGFDAEDLKGSPVIKQCKNASVTGVANTVIPIGTFDNLLQGTEYILSEVSAPAGFQGNAAFLILEGFSNQKGLTRIIPIKATGLADQIEGSVKLTKQTYNLSVISGDALSAAAVTIQFELIASRN